MATRTMPDVVPLDRYAILYETFKCIQEPKQLPRKDPESITAYNKVMELRTPKSAPSFPKQQLDKCKLPVPPVDVRQGWAIN